MNGEQYAKLHSVLDEFLYGLDNDSRTAFAECFASVFDDLKAKPEGIAAAPTPPIPQPGAITDWLLLVFQVMKVLSALDPKAAMAVITDFKAVLDDAMAKDWTKLKTDLKVLLGDLINFIPASQRPGFNLDFHA